MLHLVDVLMMIEENDDDDDDDNDNDTSNHVPVLIALIKVTFL